MGNLLIINSTLQETRAALIENGYIIEFYVERKRDRSYVGNIYLGKVVRVLPGMQAAFVEIGLEKAAFLYVGEVYGGPLDLSKLVDEDGGIVREGNSQNRGKSIDELLHEGQHVLVQVTKDPIGTKGARLTSYITLPGRHVVFMPTVEHVGVSRRIENEKERRRLRKLLDQMRPPGTGIIARTVAADVTSEDLKADVDFLVRLWNDLIERKNRVRPPVMLHRDLDLALRSIRDLCTSEVLDVVIDDERLYSEAQRFVDQFMPHHKPNLQHYQDPEPIFDAFGVEQELTRAMQRRVDLPSGGSLIIDQSEALTAVDVNTGSFVGDKSLEETITQTNVEAAREIAYQLRLRNIGGIVVLDAIDMNKGSNRDKVFRALKEAFKGDRARPNIVRISEIGLIEMTRKRVSESLPQLLTEPCAHCRGRANVKSKATVCYEIFREIKRQAPMLDEGEGQIVVHASREVIGMLQGDEREGLRELERVFHHKIEIKARGGFQQDQFEVHAVSGGKGRRDRGGQSAEGANGTSGSGRGRSRRGRRGRGGRGSGQAQSGGDSPPPAMRAAQGGDGGGAPKAAAASGGAKSGGAGQS